MPKLLQRPSCVRARGEKRLQWLSGVRELGSIGFRNGVSKFRDMRDIRGLDLMFRECLAVV